MPFSSIATSMLEALVSPATPAFTVADLHLVKARFSVPDTALHMFRAGRPLPLTVDAFADERFQGHVLSVAPAADPKARSFEIVVTIDNPALKLRSGMIASIHVADEAAVRHQVRIPIDALVHDPTRDQYLVYTLEQKGRGITAVKAVHVRPGRSWVIKSRSSKASPLANGSWRRERTCFAPAMS